LGCSISGEDDTGSFGRNVVEAMSRAGGRVLFFNGVGSEAFLGRCGGSDPDSEPFIDDNLEGVGWVRCGTGREFAFAGGSGVERPEEVGKGDAAEMGKRGVKGEEPAVPVVESEDVEGSGCIVDSA
jgi:hypothetical protein